jgi:RNA polymerase sigma-70 factor (ECF subfamily)
MLKIMRLDGPATDVLKLEGKIVGAWVPELRAACARRDGRSGRRLTLDLEKVSFIDQEGIALIQDLSLQGVGLANCSPFTAVQLRGAHEASTTPIQDSTEEDALVNALRRGEEWAFEAMVRTYGGRLLAVARRYTATDEDARDVVQTVYLNAFRSFGQFKGGARLSTWLHRIAVNTALMKLRSARRRPEESIDDLLPAFQEDGHHVEQFSEWSTPADRLLEQAQTRATVRACIMQLPEQYRTVLMLRDIDELSTQEVATMMDITPNAVKVRLHRARQALSTLLRREFAAPVVTA